MKKSFNYPASCHCGNIQFNFESKFSPKELPIRTCACLYCSKQGNLYSSDPDGVLKVKIKSPSNLKKFKFGTKSADFAFCSKCGIMAYITCKIENQTYAVINTNCIDMPFTKKSEIPVLDYSAETLTDRLARRKKNWIGKVVITK